MVFTRTLSDISGGGLISILASDYTIAIFNKIDLISNFSLTSLFRPNVPDMGLRDIFLISTSSSHPLDVTRDLGALVNVHLFFRNT